MKTINYTVDINTKTSSVKQGEKDVKDLGKTTKKVSKDATKNIDAMGGALNALPAPIQRIVMGFKTLKTAIASSGIGLFLVAAGALAGLFTAATKKGAEFAKQMSTLRAVSNASAEEMDALSASAKELGATTQFTAIQVGELQTEFAKMGFTTDQILASTKATLDLAASMEVDLASAAMLAGSTVNAFGLEAEDTQRVVDVLAKSTSSSALDFTSLQEALKNVSPAAKATGRTIEETSALLGVLANNGVKGGRAGTGLSKAFIELNKKGIPLNEALDKIKNSSNGLNTALGLAGNIGGRALLSLADKQGEIKDLTDQFNNAAGAAQAMADTRLDNLAGDTSELNSAWEGFLLSLEDGEGIFSKISRVFVQTLTAIITKVTETSKVFGAFVGEIQDSFEVAGRLRFVFERVFKGISFAGLKLKEAFSKIPFIGDKIDKNKLKEDQQAVINSLIVIDEKLKIYAKRAEERQAEGTFMERFRNRLKKAEREKLLKDLEEAEEAAAEKQAKLDEEALAKRKKAYEKYLAFRNKLVKRQEDFDDKTEEEKLARQKERDLKELAALKVSSKKKAEARLLIDKFYADKFLELENKKQAEAKKIEEAARLEREKKQREEQEENLKAQQDELAREEQQWNLLQQIRNTAEEQELLDLTQQYEAKFALAQGNAELEKALEEQQQIDLAAIEDKYLKESIEANKKADEEKKASDNALKQAKIDNQVAILSATSSILSSIGQIANAFAGDDEERAKKAFNINKGLGIAQAIISTAQGIMNAYTNPVDVASGLAIPKSIAIGVAGAAQIATIAATKYKPTGGGSSSAGAAAVAAATPSTTTQGGGAGTSPSQAPSFNVVGQSGFNQIAGALGQQGPVQAFVVSGDVTTAQELQNNTITQATF